MSSATSSANNTFVVFKTQTPTHARYAPGTTLRSRRLQRAGQAKSRPAAAKGVMQGVCRVAISHDFHWLTPIAAYPGS
jgi:hypothetical protein